jgi:hypothetical protein
MKQLILRNDPPTGTSVASRARKMSGASGFVSGQWYFSPYWGMAPVSLRLAHEAHP